MKLKQLMIIGTMAAVAAGCCNECGKVPRKPVQNVKFIELDPGHFHAALVLNRSYEGVSKDVRVFAPKGPDVEAHQKLVTAFNTREKDPTACRRQGILCRGSRGQEQP